ncbi:MAG: ATP-binding protein [Bacteroidetes bacterium]|nr:ATP-binding protein [Bacteroidota bacterium]
MEKHLLKSLIVFHKQRFLEEKKLVKREILTTLIKFLDTREVIFISGIRRSGKSTLMSLIAKEILTKRDIKQSNILFINFEDERFINFTSEDFEKLYQTYLEIENPAGKKYLFFDEIQNINGWERWINRLNEFEDVKIFITGSNASLISSSISTSLTGRNRQIQNQTFSFKEYLWFLGLNVDERDLCLPEKIVEIKRAFENYLKLGGFPEVLKNGDITLAEQYFKDIIHRDVVSRYNIRNVKEIRELSLYLITNSGCLASYESLRSAIAAKNASTIKNFLTILEDVYLIRSLSLYDFSLKKQLYNPDKYYVNDIGFYHAVGFRFSENIGRVLETIVFQQLLRKGLDIFYWKSPKASEVDFLVSLANNRKEAIQVTYSLTQNNLARETIGLTAINERFSGVDKLILTYDEEKTIEYATGTVKVLPVWKWLLE